MSRQSFRIYRTFFWVNTSNMIGGPPSWECLSEDRLQYWDGDWVDVPTVEAERPLNPDQAALDRKMKETEAWIDAALGGQEQ